MGLEWRTISGYEGEEFEPSEAVIEKLAHVLDFPRDFSSGIPSTNPKRIQPASAQ